MASAKFPGCDIINLDSEEHGGDERGSTVAEEVFRSGIRLNDESMSLSVHFSPVNQSEIGDSNPCFHFIDSNSDSGSVFLDPEPDPHSCFIDFFNRESYEVDRGRESSSGGSNLWSFYEMDEDIDLGLGIGSGSVLGEENLQVIDLDGDSDIENTESDSGRVEAVTGLTPIENNLFVEEEAMMVADEELEWENLQNAIYWDPEPIVSLFALEEEEDRDREELSLASRDDQHDNLQVLLDASIVIEEDDGVMMDIFFNGYESIGSIGEYGENYGDYDAFFLYNESVITGSPPASKRVVEDLPVVEITSEELRNGNIVCAICKDDVVVEEKVKRLPCRHYYHGECIIPWLGIRNTCPVCRYELPTDDLEYERNRRTQSHGLVADLMSE